MKFNQLIELLSQGALDATLVNLYGKNDLDDKIYASFVRNNTIWNIPASADEGWSFPRG